MQYRPHRYPTDCRVKVVVAKQPVVASVVDVNRSGARLHGLAHLNRGEKIQIEVLYQRVEAIVLWARAGFTGVVFRPAISDQLVDVLRKRGDRPGLQDRHRLGYRYAELR